MASDNFGIKSIKVKEIYQGEDKSRDGFDIIDENDKYHSISNSDWPSIKASMINDDEGYHIEIGTAKLILNKTQKKRIDEISR